MILPSMGCAASYPMWQSAKRLLWFGAMGLLRTVRELPTEIASAKQAARHLADETSEAVNQLSTAMVLVGLVAVAALALATLALIRVGA